MGYLSQNQLYLYRYATSLCTASNYKEAAKRFGEINNLKVLQEHQTLFRFGLETSAILGAGSELMNYFNAAREDNIHHFPQV